MNYISFYFVIKKTLYVVKCDHGAQQVFTLSKPEQTLREVILLRNRLRHSDTLCSYVTTPTRYRCI